MKHPFSDVRDFQRDATGLLSRDCRDGEPLKRLRLGFTPVFQITDPDLVKPVLKTDEAVIDKGRMVHKLRSVVGMSSLTISGPENTRRRGVTHDQLRKGLTEGFVPMICELYDRVIGRLPQEGATEVHSFTGPLALRVICSVLFGRGVLTAGDEATLISCVKLVEDDLADSITRILPDLPHERLAKRRKLRFALEAMDFVVARARERASDGSILAGLEGLGLSDTDLRDELLMLMLAGHHTTGTAGAWILYYLATEPGLAERVAAEAEAAIDPATGAIDARRLPRCALSLNVVREVLRLYPSSYWFARELRQDHEVAGHRLRKGTSLIVSPWQFGRDPRFWDAPGEFRLGRDYASKAYLPFGAGPRACVGIQVATLELQLLALEFARKLELRAVSPVPAPLPRPSLTLIPPPIVLDARQRVSRPQKVAA